MYVCIVMLLSLDTTVSNVSVRNISRRTIDLNGPEGNAFYLIGLVSSTAKQLGMSKHTITTRMMSGDYFNLLAEFEAAFGDFYYLILTDDIDSQELENRASQIRKEVYNVQN